MKNKTQQTTGWLDNFNNSKVSLPPGFVGEGTFNGPQWKSPAWGGQFEEGGEIPQAQNGRPTRADSVLIMNNAIAKNNFYKNNPNYYKIDDGDKFFHLDLTDPKVLKNMAKKIIEEKNYIKNRKDSDISNSYDDFKDEPNRFRIRYKDLKDKLGKLPGSNNIYSTPDVIDNSGPDLYFNPAAPPVLFSPSIIPQGVAVYASNERSGYGDMVYSPYYDPLAVKPFDMRTPQEKIEWEKKYGKKNPPSEKPKEKPKEQPKPEPQPSLKKKVTKMEPIPSKGKSTTPQLRTIEQPNIELPAVERGQYRTSYYDPQMKDWNERAFMSQQESDQFADEMSKRGYPGSYGNVTQRTQYQLGGNVYPVNYVPQAQDGISFLPQQDPEMMYTDRFNTQLNKDEQNLFAEWAAKESERQGRDIMMDKGAYDVQGFWKSGDYNRMVKGHGTDTWKKPNHPTFSNQSKYHGIDGFYGGNWTSEDGYQPSKQSADMYGPSYYNWMFGREPERPEHLDASRYMSGANKPSPLYFAMGGSIPGSVGFTYARTKGIPSEGPYAKKTMPSAQNGQEMKYYQEGLDWKPKSISKNGGWLDKYIPEAQGGLNIPGVTDFKMPLNRTDATGLSIQEKQKQDAAALEIQRRNEATAKQQFIGTPHFQTLDEQRTNKQKKKQFVRNNPNTEVNDQDEIVSKNPDRDFEGKPVTPNAKRWDKGLEHMMNALEATSALTGSGQIGSNLLRLGASALEKKIGRNIVSKSLKNFTSSINPTLGAIDDAGAYVQLDPVGIMGNKLNSNLYNPTTALNTANNTITGVDKNLKNSALEASDLILGDNNLRNLTGSSVENTDIVNPLSKEILDYIDTKPSNLIRFLTGSITPANIAASGLTAEILNKNLSDEDIKKLPKFIREYVEKGNFLQNPELIQKKKGGVIKDDRGQWDHPGEITEIQGNTMATHGYGDLPLYVVPDVGEPRVVEANTGTHTFPGAKKFTEIPIAQKGKTLPPLYTDDPRKVEKYIDSLNLYNRFKDAKSNYTNFISSQGFNPSYIEEWPTNGWVDQNIHPEIGAIKYGILKNLGGGMDRDIKGTPRDYNYYPTKSGKDQKVYEGSDLSNIIGKRYPIYKKPVQPYKLEEPSLKRKPVDVELIKSKSSTTTPGIKTMSGTPVKEQPVPKRGEYRVSYYNPDIKDWSEQAFETEKESDKFADEMSKRGYGSGAGTVTQTRKVSKKENGGWLSQYK